MSRAFDLALERIRKAQDPEEALAGFMDLHRAEAVDRAESAFLLAMDRDGFHEDRFDRHAAESLQEQITMMKDRHSAYETPEMIAQFEATIREAFRERSQQMILGLAEGPPR